MRVGFEAVMSGNTGNPGFFTAFPDVSPENAIYLSSS
jgi:hypothetical protein